jgi:hypothetical protein
VSTVYYVLSTDTSHCNNEADVNLDFVSEFRDDVLLLIDKTLLASIAFKCHYRLRFDQESGYDLNFDSHVVMRASQ